MALLADILSRVRMELGDQQKNFTFSGVGDGSTKAFYLNAKPIELTNLYITVGGTPIAYPSGYSLEAGTGIVTFTTAPSLNAVILANGMADRYFLDTDLTTFINTAVTQHTYNKTDAYGSSISLNSIPAVEEYPLAILAVIEALWALATDASFDININAPDGVVIPRAQRYAQLSETIQQRTEQYKTLCAQLNIGLYRIEMGTLIRVSRLTNKLVPIYMAQEIDDSRRPERVYIHNDLMGRTPTPTTVQTYDLCVYQGDSWYIELDFPFDVSPYTLAAQIRTYPNAPSLYATFTVAVISATSNLSRVKLSLTSDETDYLPVRAFWDLQATSASDSTYEKTYMKGQVFTTQQVTI